MKDFAAIDFETANYRPTSICSVGVVVVREGEIVERFHHFIRPRPNYYTARFTNEIHGISRAQTDQCPHFPEVWSKVEPVIEGLPLVAHNKMFDEGVLRKTFEAYDMDYPEYEFHCTYHAARRTLPKMMIGNYRLPTVCEFLGIEFTNHHDALADAEGCARIAMKIL